MFEKCRFTDTPLTAFWRDRRHSADVSSSRQPQSWHVQQVITVYHTKTESAWCATVLGGTLRSCSNQISFFFLTRPQDGSLLEASPLLQSAADTILHCPFSPLTAYMTYFHNINTPTGVDDCITTLQISGELSNKVSRQRCCFITATPKIQNLSGCCSQRGDEKATFQGRQRWRAGRTRGQTAHRGRLPWRRPWEKIIKRVAPMGGPTCRAERESSPM